MNTATEIDEIYLNEDRPTPTGGTIADGTYELVSRVIYTGPTGMTGPTGTKFRETAEIQSTGPGALRLKAAITINGGPEQYPVLLATLKGIHFDALPTCGGTLSLSVDFDATPTELKTYVTVNGAPLIATFKKK